MEFADNIRIKPDPVFDSQWAAEFKQLTGYDWPKTDDEFAWATLLSAAGFSHEEQRKIATEADVADFYAQTFTARIIEGLRQRNPTQPDTKTDTAKKTSKKRMMNTQAADCARLYREQRAADSTITLKQVVAEYVEAHGGSCSSIERILNDNPDQWRTG